MPVIIIGMSVWAYVLYGAGATAGVVGTWYAAKWGVSRLAERQRLRIEAEMVDAFRIGGRDGLEDFLYDKGLAKNARHAELVMRAVLPSIETAAGFANLREAVHQREMNDPTGATVPQGRSKQVTEVGWRSRRQDGTTMAGAAVVTGPAPSERSHGRAESE
jgi:hypothetical protein